jgi:predicted transcriptional regulator
VLEEVGGPVHLDDIADALGINRAYADNVALRALRAGLVTRDGVGTGRVQLAGEGAPCQPVVRRRAGRGARPTRLELLLELLQGRDEPVHISEVAGTLGLTRTHADNVVAYGVNYGLVSRTGDRTGRIVLAGMQPAAT